MVQEEDRAGEGSPRGAGGGGGGRHDGRTGRLPPRLAFRGAQHEDRAGSG